MSYSILMNDTLAHAGKKGMKWGYNDGSRNGRRTAAEISAVKKQMEEMAKKDSSIKVGEDVQGDYDEANNMLKYLGITLDMQSDDEAVVKTMQVYKEMANNKDKYENQYEWLKDFTKKLSGVGYDMSATEKFLDEKKADINKIKTGSGTGDRSKSNADWKENDAKKSSKKSSSSSEKKSSSKSTSSKSKKASKSSSKKAEVSSSVKKKVSESKSIRDKTTITHRLVMEGDELYHHGILGQKWGVRRYQNTDGSLTSEGRQHYGYKNMSDSELREAVNRKRLENRYKDLKTGRGSNVAKGAENASGKASQLAKAQFGDKNPKTKTVNAAGAVAKDAGKIVDKATEAKIKSEQRKIDTSKMSKEELQKAVNRLELEKEYEKLNKADIERGKLITTDTLQNIGLVASTAVDVVTLAVLINKVIKK